MPRVPQKNGKLNHTWIKIDFINLQKIYSNLLVINEKDLKSLLKSVEICDINSYGIFKCKLNNINFEFVKNLCCDQLCDRCKKYTFIHFTPAFDIKMCMSSEELIKLDYSDYNNFKNILDKF